MKYKIYKLIHNGIVQYVGRTTRTLKSRKGSGYGKNTELFKSFDMELIEETDDVSRERYWISYYRNINPNIFNIFKGDGFVMKEYKKEYILNNKDRIKENQKEYKLKNKDRIKENQKEYHKEYQKKYRLKQKEYKLKSKVIE